MRNLNGGVQFKLIDPVPKNKQARAFAGLEHRLTFVLRPVALACDAVGTFVEAIKSPDASPTSCSDCS
jgi:hypothetical protein